MEKKMALTTRTVACSLTVVEKKHAQDENEETSKTIEEIRSLLKLKATICAEIFAQIECA